MSKSSSFLKAYEYDLSRNPLLKKIQRAALGWQIKKKLGWKIWRILFKECHYKVDIDQLTIIAANERAANVIARRYRSPLEKLFAAKVHIEIQESRQ